jgi:hypothetical protein
VALEDVMAENTAAVNLLNENFARFFDGEHNTGGAGGKTTETTAAATAEPGKRGPGRPPKVKVPTLDDVSAIAEKVKDVKGRGVAINIIKAHGADRLAGLDPSKYAAFIAACEVVMNEPEPAAAEEEPEL